MQAGELVQWNDERGFGFILAADGQRYFVHISQVGRIATRPRIGDRVSFVPGKGDDGRLQARQVAIAGANSRPSREVLERGLPSRSGDFGWRGPLALAMVATAASGALLGTLPWPLALLYLVAGTISFCLYGADKAFAESDQWRISEAMLLTVDLCFGIVGGLIGQAFFRHKTRKPGYVATTLLLAGVHALWLCGLAAGLIQADELLALLPH